MFLFLVFLDYPYSLRPMPSGSRAEDPDGTEGFFWGILIKNQNFTLYFIHISTVNNNISTKTI
jgi:hypothetical protein